MAALRCVVWAAHLVLSLLYLLSMRAHGLVNPSTDSAPRLQGEAGPRVAVKGAPHLACRLDRRPLDAGSLPHRIPLIASRINLAEGGMVPHREF